MVETQDRTKSILFTPLKMGDIELKNRIVVSSLTRTRADPTNGIATDLHAEYY